MQQFNRIILNAQLGKIADLYEALKLLVRLLKLIRAAVLGVSPVFRHAFVVTEIIKEAQQWRAQTHVYPIHDISMLGEMGGEINPPSNRRRGGGSSSEQEVSDKGEQLCQLGLHVVRLSDGVAAEIKMLQLGAGGQWLKIGQGGDFWTSELKRSTLEKRALAVKAAFNSSRFLAAGFVTFSNPLENNRPGQTMLKQTSQQLEAVHSKFEQSF